MSEVTLILAAIRDGELTNENLVAAVWNFQLWYRDPAGRGGSGFNLSDGLSIPFCP